MAIKGQPGCGGERGREGLSGLSSFLLPCPSPLPSLPLSVPAAGDTEERTVLAQPSQQLSTLSATSLHSGDPPAAPPTSIFLQVASYLLDVHALKVRVKWSNCLLRL